MMFLVFMCEDDLNFELCFVMEFFEVLGCDWLGDRGVLRGLLCK